MPRGLRDVQEQLIRISPSCLRVPNARPVARHDVATAFRS